MPIISVCSSWKTFVGTVMVHSSCLHMLMAVTSPGTSMIPPSIRKHTHLMVCITCYHIDACKIKLSAFCPSLKTNASTVI